MRISRSALAVCAALVLALTGCVGAPTPSPPSGSPSSAPSPGGSPAPAPQAEDDDDAPPVTPAVVVVTSATLAVFGSDGSTLASVGYAVDGATAVAEISAALGAAPAVSAIDGEPEGPCPPATAYDFGGLRIESPGSLWSAGAYEAVVTGATTGEGVAIETIAGQRIGAAQPAFQAAVGEFVVLYDTPERLGVDILNPEAPEGDRVGTYAEFSGGALTYLAAPNRLGFIGSCA